MKLKITQIGQPKDVQTKYGLKQTNWIKAEEYGDKYLNYWLGESTKSWATNVIIEVESVEPRDYTAKDGTLKTAYNIKLPRTGFGELIKRIEKLENDFAKFKLEIPTILKQVEYPDDSPYANPPF